jgi:Nitrile hydratase beta subunit
MAPVGTMAYPELWKNARRRCAARRWSAGRRRHRHKVDKRAAIDCARADECVWYDSLMDGVHDMGGIDGFGKIEVEKNEPVFHAAWEGRVLAMQRAMTYAGAWRIDHSRFAKEKLPPIIYLSASYYQRWVLGMEKNVIERGFATAEELKAGHATSAGRVLQRKLTVSVLREALARVHHTSGSNRHLHSSNREIAFAPETSVRRPTHACHAMRGESWAWWRGAKAVTCILTQ